MSESLYEILVLGSVPDTIMKPLENWLSERLEDFELKVGDDVRILYSEDLPNRRPEVATCAIYFGGDAAIDAIIIDELRSYLVPILPVVMKGQSVSEALPNAVQSLNAVILKTEQGASQAIGSVVLENLGLMREQRRAFISYRRNEASTVAQQLYDEFSSNGYDAFLDVNGIRASAEFQEKLWDKLCDSDVLVMLDTAGYYDSHWTEEELARARAKDIKVLRIAWADNKSPNDMDFADTYFLDDGSFEDGNGATGSERLTEAACDEIGQKLEDVRSRSIAARFIAIAGKLRVGIQTLKGTVQGVASDRSLLVTLPQGEEFPAYPAVGVPTAEIIHSIEERYNDASYDCLKPMLVYDHVGIGQQWSKHLSWLDKNLQSVELIKVEHIAWDLYGKIRTQ